MVRESYEERHWEEFIKIYRRWKDETKVEQISMDSFEVQVIINGYATKAQAMKMLKAGVRIDVNLWAVYSSNKEVL